MVMSNARGLHRMTYIETLESRQGIIPDKGRKWKFEGMVQTERKIEDGHVVDFREDIE